MRDLGYENHNSILILGSIWIFALVYFIKVCAYLFLKLVRKNNKKYKFPWLEKLSQGMFFNEILELIVDAYMEWLIAGKLNYDLTSTRYGGDIAGNFSTFLALLLCLVFFPIILIKQMYKPLTEINSVEYQNRYGMLTEDIKTTLKLYSNYFSVWAGRRIAFLMIAFNL